MNNFDNDEVRGGAKKPRVRSIAYPSYTIEFCYELTLKIHQIFGSNIYNSREDISKNINVSVSHLLTQLSSCVQYGLLDIKSKEGYRPTPLFTTIYRPLDEAEKQDGLNKAFSSPELYQKLIAQFDNQALPSTNGLATILLRNYKVSESAAPLAARIFLENADTLNLIDGSNTFRFSDIVTERITDINNAIVSDIHTNTEMLSLNSGSPEPINTINYVPEKPISDKEFSIPISFKDGSEGHVVLPKPFTNEHLNKIIRVLTGYIDD